MFLSPNGEWIGNVTGSHRDTVMKALKKSNIDMEDDDNLVTNIIKSTGMMRVNAGSELSLDIAHPISSSQRKSLKDYIITKNKTPDEIHIQVRGKMNGKKTDFIKNSLIENVVLSGPQSTVQVKKKKRHFEFVENSNDSWKELEHYLYEDSTNSVQKSDTVGNPEFRSFTHSSSFVGNVLWDRESREMDIILNGKKYHFCNVSERLYDSFEGASSKGVFFNREIKTLHDC